MDRPIPKRKFGRTGVDVTILGLGGEGVLRTFGKEKEADALINTALDLGINYMESARAYSGSEAYYGLALKERRDKVLLASKSHARDKKGVLGHLEETLRNMKTDYLDLWYIHDVRTDDEVNKIFGPEGAIEGFIHARDKGLVKYIGVTGHHDPLIIKKCLESFDFDAVLVPVNPAEPFYKCFLDEVVPLASAKDTAIAGMKVYMKGLFQAPRRLLLSYALTQPISTAVVGCDNIDQMNENAEAASEFQPLKYKEVQRFTQMIEPYARQLMFYKP
ncbi:MAG TPA: aldo/keto reductase [Deltaproteobacteria bacterium]|nr:MAG: aldo/keto reductase [Deltaproteobacteria bacterium GWA2_55_82]OGQ64505.1 MAG: aldo/keto reductase [Deltaproteobacteria bacterium RIFCSPLOWO2_02_FULL_55_12]OIJ73630.1 MAG: aldo/keto reductase [Deltaproteobacteria bacterium GWC2_55_46]HBG47768.1 aldo/keto reductase [Deltaproteobacteria bacterium]HCY12010.1 aldo/keto reductase [Deltaproteobacteria bacterium]